MATNVFGEPVIEKTPLESAIKARRHRNAGSKRDDAIAYLNSEKQKWGHGVATLCMFYNATGQTLDRFLPDSWHGRVASGNFPHTVQNGQWGAYLHVEDTDSTSGSVGFVVYRGKYTGRESFCKLLFAWETPGGASSNLAYCDILDDDMSIERTEVYQKMKYKNSNNCPLKKNGMFTTSTIKDGTTTPFYEVILAIDDTAASKNSI